MLTYIDIGFILIPACVIGTAIWRSGEDCRRVKRQKEDDRRREQDRYEGPEDIDGTDITVITTHIQAIAHQLHTQNDQQSRQDIERAFREKITIGALIVAGVAAAVSAAFLYCQLIDAREAAATQHNDTLAALGIAQQSNRAWVGQVDVAISGPIQPDGSYKKIEAGDVIVTTATIQNSGHEPAYDVDFQPLRLQVYTVEDWSNGNAARRMRSAQKSCSSDFVARGGNIMFPSQAGRELTFDLGEDAPANAPVIMTKEIMGGTNVLVLLYCIHYVAAGQTHHTAFGYFFRGGRTSPSHLGGAPEADDAD